MGERMFIEPRERVIKQQMAINGQINEWDESIGELCCGKCGAPLMKAGNSAADGYKLIFHQKDQLAQQLQFCPHCGEKIDFDIIIDTPASEVTVVYEEKQQPVKTEDEKNEPK